MKSISQSSNKSTKEVIQHVFPAKHTWDGQLSTFQAFKKKLVGHYCQVGAGYLFNKNFLESYESNDYHKQTILLHEDLGAPNTISQFNKDLNALYGALESACEDGVGQEILIKYHDSADGLCAWIDMLHLYDAGGILIYVLNNLKV